jgi:hypothetical protein
MTSSPQPDASGSHQPASAPKPQSTARNLDRSTEPMQQQTLAALQAELFQARVTLNQLRAELNETRTDRRASPDDLDKVIGRASDAVADLDTAASRIHQRLKPSRSIESAD